MVDTKAHSPETHPVSAAANAVEDSGAIMIKNPVGCLGAIALGMIVGILLLVATCSKLNERGSGDTNLVPSDAIYKAAAEKLVRRQLRDPESAIFSDMYVVGTRPDRSDVGCGTVNSRNGFGGMAGGQRFIVEIGRASCRERVCQSV